MVESDCVGQPRYLMMPLLQIILKCRSLRYNPVKHSNAVKLTCKGDGTQPFGGVAGRVDESMMA